MQKTPGYPGSFVVLKGWASLYARETAVDGAEYVADDWTKQHEDRNNNDCYQNKNQRVLYEALSFFFRGE
jgi:hypothetical protein